MRTETPVAVKLSDYSPYPFEIEKVDLSFDLAPSVTRVTTRLSVVPLSDAPMVLNGEALELKCIRINPDADTSPLPQSAYELNDGTLTLHTVPREPFILETIVEIAPDANKALSGLYISGGRFCTQCEAIGFRRITFYPDRPDVMSSFSVWMAADKADYPILLSNGTPGEAGDLPGGRHFATWVDPHKKPAYLFALCAGDYDVYEDDFTTASGAPVKLAIHVDKGDAQRAAWAMDSLKRSMTWDEEVYGREYDLGVFNIVAVRDFNFGAMENKGLNIFNSAYVLADEASATDADFEAIESIVAHEYFHNWTGNRITCRDWFQLCLKEGLTVFRDQNFSADMRSRPVQRIKDVIRLRARQFAEDAGPLAHPVRPDTYGAIDNLYTATVYEKGAELIGMLRRQIGGAEYRRGVDLYFDRHDGQAVTIEDFYKCFEDVTGDSFAAFKLWYAQSGTPVVTVIEAWDAGAATLTVTLSQATPPTPNQAEKQVMPIPLLCALLDGAGGHVAADGQSGADQWLELLETRERTLEFKLPAGSDRPLFSINRDFTAPVRLERELSKEDSITFMKAETDPFNQWDAVQGLIKDEILALSDDAQGAPDTTLLTVWARVVENNRADPAFAALLMRLPEVGELFLERQPADPVALQDARDRLQDALFGELAAFAASVLDAPTPTPYNPGAEQAGVRALRSACIELMGASNAGGVPAKLLTLYKQASNMTERLAALRALVGQVGSDARRTAIDDFEQRFKDNPLIMDKWFAVQARQGNADVVQQLVEHPDFDILNPNRVRSVASVFAIQNLAAFHAPDGSGHRVIENIILSADKVNPALGARLLTAFEQWKILEQQGRTSAQATLKRLLEAGLSKNAADIVSRALG